MVKKHFDRKHSFGRRFIAVLLSLLLLVSTCAVAFAVSDISGEVGAGTYTVKFTNNKNWGGTIYCYAWNESGGQNASWPGVAMTFDKTNEFNQSVYKCTVSTDYNKVIFNNNSNQTDDINTGSQSTNYYVNDDGHSVSTWTESGGDEGGESGDMTFSAPVNPYNSANTDSSKIFWAKATYFDYLSDQEISNTKWLKPVQAGTENFNGAEDEWFPFYKFNRDVVKSRASSTWQTPMYFGNFCNTNGAFDTHSHHIGLTDGGGVSGFNDATGSYNVSYFKYALNNSNKENANESIGGTGLANMNQSYQNLMKSTLDSDGNLLLPNGNKAPYFDPSTLSGYSGYAKVINSSFPFNVSEKNGYTQYKFNSNGAADNVYFTWKTEGNQTVPQYVNYGAGTNYGVKDGISMFMHSSTGQTSGYGIFPFNNANTTQANQYKGTKTYANENLNYGFGVKLEVNFRVPKPSDTVNTALNPITFKFSGDDDLWMYITNNRTGVSQLVLDMGGNHKKSTGEVNFNSLKAKVDHVYQGNNSSDSSATKSFNFNYDDTYTMSVFYMERGLIESNCEMTFTMSPAGNQVKVDKVVDVANAGINTEQLQNAVKTAAANEQFGFIGYDNGAAKANAQYHYNGTTPNTASDGKFYLKDGENAAFLSKYTINKNVYVKEVSKGSRFKYNTSWSVVDPVDSSRNTSGNGDTAATLTLKNPSGAEYDYAELDYTFTNTPKTGSVAFEKVISGNSASDTTEFGATVTVSIDGGTTYNPYPLTYKASDKSGTFSLSSTGELNSGALLKQGRVLTFEGIPVGAKVKLVEQGKANYQFGSVSGSTVTESGNGGIITVPETGTNKMTVTNNPVEQGNLVTVKKIVNAASVNSTELQNRIKADESFKFKILDNDVPKASTYYNGTQRTTSQGTFNLKNQESADFDSKFTVNGYTEVQEDLSANKILYNTTWSYTNPETSDADNGTGTVVGAYLEGATGSVYDYAELDFTFTNTPKLGSVSVTKVIEGASSDNKEFDATVTVSIDGSNYYAYPLTYTASDKAGSFKLGNDGKLNANARLKQGRTLTFNNLPAGAKVRVIENIDNVTANSYSFKQVTGNGVTAEINGGSVTVPTNTTTALTVVNTPISPDDIYVNLKAFKVLQGVNGIKLPGSASEAKFTFTLMEGSPSSSPIQSVTYNGSTVNNNNRAEVDFTPIKFSNEATKTYYIKETQGDDPDLRYSTEVYRADVKITKNTSTNQLTQSVTYYDSDGEELMTNQYPTFTNTIRKGSVKIVKYQQHDPGETPEKLNNTTFALYRVNSPNDPNLKAESRVGTAVTGQNGNAEGEAKFENLEIYTSGSTYLYDDEEKEVQWYCLVEANTDGKHNPSAVKTYFCLPEYGNDGEPNYDITFTFQNGTVFPPAAGSIGSGMFRTVGLVLIGLSAALALGFGLFKLRSRAAKKKSHKRFH